MAATGQRVALIIANSDYRYAPHLKNPPSDAALLASALRRAGFDSVVVRSDLDKAGMNAALIGFGDAAEGAEVAMLYYAGHGVEVSKHNYLVPVEARLQHDRTVPMETVDLDDVLKSLSGAKLRIVVLDACRDNPFVSAMRGDGGTRSAASRGLGRAQPQEDMLIAYSAAEGQVALDGAGANSPFAVALAQRVVQPQVELGRLFRLVRDDVRTATQGMQAPFTYGSISSDEVYLASRAAQAGVRPQPAIALPAAAPVTVAPKSATSANAYVKRAPPSPSPAPSAVPSAAVMTGGRFAALCNAGMISITHPTVNDINGTKWYKAVNGAEMVQLSACDPASGKFSTHFPRDIGSLPGTGGTISDRRLAFDFGYRISGYNIHCNVTATRKTEARYEGQIVCDGRKTSMLPQAAIVEF